MSDDDENGWYVKIYRYDRDLEDGGVAEEYVVNTTEQAIHVFETSLKRGFTEIYASARGGSWRDFH